MPAAKPWQIAVIAGSVALSAGVIAWTVFGSEAAPTQPDVYLLDVETGDLWVANPRRQTIVVPARRPGDGPEAERTIALVRLDKDEAGKFIVNERDLEMLDWMDKSVQNKFVDPRTGQLLQAPASGAKSYPRS